MLADTAYLDSTPTPLPSLDRGRDDHVRESRDAALIDGLDGEGHRVVRGHQGTPAGGLRPARRPETVRQPFGGRVHQQGIGAEGPSGTVGIDGPRQDGGGLPAVHLDQQLYQVAQRGPLVRPHSHPTPAIDHGTEQRESDARVARPSQQRGQADQGDALDEGGPRRLGQTRGPLVRLDRAVRFDDRPRLRQVVPGQGRHRGVAQRPDHAVLLLGEGQSLIGGAGVGAGLGKAQQGHSGLVGMIVQPRQSEHLGMIVEAVVEPADVQGDHPAEPEPEHASLVVGSVDLAQRALGELRRQAHLTARRQAFADCATYLRRTVDAGPRQEGRGSPGPRRRPRP